MAGVSINKPGVLKNRRVLIVCYFVFPEALQNFDRFTAAIHSMLFE